MSEFKYSLRKWKSRKIEFSVLICGLAMVISLGGLLLSLYPVIAKSSPDWVSNDAALATVMLEDFNGKTSPVSLDRLKAIESRQGVEEVFKLGFDSVEVRIEGVKEELNTMFIDERAVSELGLSDILSARNYMNSSWLNSTLTDEHLARDVTLLGNNTRLSVSGEIPKGLREVAGKSIDLIVVTDHFFNSQQIDFGDNPPPPQYLNRVRERVINALPRFYGLIRLSSGFSAKDLTLNDIQGQASDDVSVLSSTTSLNLKAFDGVDFTPAERQNLRKRWFLLLCVFGIFFFVNLSLIIAHSVNSAITRESELSTRTCLGASRKNLISIILLEYLPVIACSTIFSVILYGWGVAHINSLFIAITESISITDLVTAFSLSFILSVALVLLSSAIPLSKLLRSEIFSRGGTNEITKGQMIGWVLIVSAQLVIAFAAMLFVISLSLSYFTFFSNISVDKTVVESRLSWNEEAHDVNLRSLVKESMDRGLTVAQSPFTMDKSFSTPIRLSASNSESEVPINVINVASNYFDVLGVGLKEGVTFDDTGIVINEEFLKTFKISKGEAIGKRVFIKDQAAFGFSDDVKIRITGMIENLEHTGVFSSEKATVYAPVDYSYNQNKVYLLGNEFSPAEKLVENNYAFAELSEKYSIGEKIIRSNIESLYLTVFTLIVGAIILIATSVSIRNICVNYIELQRKNLAIRLALGARTHSIILSIAINVLKVIALSSIVGLLLAFFAADTVSQIFAVTLNKAEVIVINLFIFFFLSLLFTVLPVYNFLRKPIREHL